MSNSLQPHGLYSPWNYLGQNTGVGSLSLLQGIFPTQGSNPALLHCRQIFYQLSHKRSSGILEWVAIPSPGDLPDPRIKLGSPALQVDSLPGELSGKPCDCANRDINILIIKDDTNGEAFFFFCHGVAEKNNSCCESLFLTFLHRCYNKWFQGRKGEPK